LSPRGDLLAKRLQFEKAIGAYQEAWKLLPEPAEDWSAATWILAAIGDAQFEAEKFEEALQTFAHAMRCPEAIGNPFLHLRLGQISFELGDRDRAADELARAYMGGGEELFASDDPSYLEFLKTRLRPPVGGWRGA
jgi:tetratricopeptide (TPR) repeat protein